MHLGFIGFGEAAFEMASGLKQQGLKKMTAYDPLWNVSEYSELISNRAAAAGVTIVQTPEEVLQQVNAVIVAVPADKALGVSSQLKSCVQKGILYIDVSASNPDVKKNIAKNIQEKGGKFVDAAMMGPLPVYKHEVPILASGDGTDTFMEIMQPFGMNITKVSDVPGEATAVKLVRSIYMKGVVGLYIELLEAAHEFNVESLVVDSLSETINGRTFEETMNRLVTGTALHAVRRSVELGGTIAMLDSVNIDSSMSKAAKEKIEKLASLNLKDKFKGEKPEHWLQVIEAFKVTN
ncbi:prephenate dehydrogenase/arogenate dehydrogenase family protein [Domibacillus sp. PGB-M46]|uniref:NAD(P)-binding domain-containing protein n=1 Tax=Domibacillus sp. PGB-M46 TaxID=2910255 RepID=UPI001F57D393|nr:NAD(P)-binding domain-containing protein [Domibacillus sp. PGB-M46]MCI2256688.1 prephenate dehydrogenase/arogenate dehydrogenase family protein [Domibacillus sp. PGB-M46]